MNSSNIRSVWIMLNLRSVFDIQAKMSIGCWIYEFGAQFVLGKKNAGVGEINVHDLNNIKSHQRG